MQSKPEFEKITKPINPSKHIERSLDERAWLAKEDKKKWAKDHPLREPGTSLKTWKSYSKQKFTSSSYREGYDGVAWRDSS